MRLKCPNCSEEIKVFKTIVHCPNCAKEFTPELVRCSNCDTLCQVRISNIVTIMNESPPHLYRSEISKLKSFMEIFNSIWNIDKKDDVEENNLINELVGSGKFNENEAREYIKKALYNGQIYERRSGFYAKA